MLVVRPHYGTSISQLVCVRAYCRVFASNILCPPSVITVFGIYNTIDRIDEPRLVASARVAVRYVDHRYYLIECV
jgi:hypothetical protein